MPMMENIIAKILLKKKLTISVAESCTGGLISSALTDIPGSSAYFVSGIVAYANETKIHLLEVSPEIMKAHGAVSKEAALALAQNVRRLCRTHIGLSVTGIAGPRGGSSLKPVGTVFVAVSLGNHLYFKKYLFMGVRRKIKRQAKDAAFQMLKECLT